MEGHLVQVLLKSVMVLFRICSNIVLGLSIGIPIFFFGDWQYGLITGASDFGLNWRNNLSYNWIRAGY